MKKIILLGASGNIGRQVIDVCLSYPSEFKIIGMSLGRDINLANELIKKVDPKYICIRECVDRSLINFNKTIFVGDRGLDKLANIDEDAILLNALVGDVGLIPTISAIKSRKDIYLANKETLCLAGPIIKNLVNEYNVKLIPIDSEHTAILSLLDGTYKSNISKIYITASGGSLRDIGRDKLKEVTKQEVLNHPNWNMGNKITVDSATMANKCFEVLEALYLFDLKPNDISVVLHKESLIHSLVKFKDNTYHMNLSSNDMRFSILYALSYPKHFLNDYKDIDFSNLILNFNEISYDRYPLLKLIFELLDKDYFKLVQFQSSNDAAVNLFLEDYIPFYMIEEIIFRYTSKDYSFLEYNINNILKLNKLIKEEIYLEYKKR